MMNTAIALFTKLDKEGTCSIIDQKLYRRMFGSLMHLTTSGHYIVFSV